MYISLNDSKPNIEKTIRMMTATYDDAYNHKGGNVTLRTLPPSDVEFYSKINLTDYDFEDEKSIDLYVDKLCDEINTSFVKRTDIDDNMIPSISPMLGIGDYSAFVAGDIMFKPDTSWSTPVLKSLEGYKDFPKLGTSKWYKRFLSISEKMLKKFDGTGIPFMRGFFSPLDLACALRGNDIYMDFYDEPNKLHDLLEYCTTAIITFAQDIYSLAEKYLGNTPYGMWMLEGNINMSEDIACMISGELYQEFCAPHTQRVINHFGRGHMHSHSRAMYLVKEICSLDNVVHLWLATDTNQPRPIDNIKQLVEDSRGTCLAIDCETYDEIVKNFADLKKGNFSVCLPTSSIEESKLIVERFNMLG